MATENNTLAKLMELHTKYFDDVEETITTCDTTLGELQKDYLNAVIDATLGDPGLAAIMARLSERIAPPAKEAPQAESVPDTAPNPLPFIPDIMTGAVPIGQSGDPSKFPMKSTRTICPRCKTRVDRNDRFCSGCATPLFGTRLAR